MDEIMLQTIIGLLNSQVKAVMATIIRTEGSSPRDPGSKMLIMENGRTIGTIGGGSREEYIVKRARSLLVAGDEFQIEIQPVVLNQEGDTPQLSACGGNMEVLLEPIKEIGLWQFALNLLLEGRDAVLITSLAAPYTKSIWDLKGHVIWGESQTEMMCLAEKIVKSHSTMQTGVIKISEELSWFAEPLLKRKRLLILGAGHVAREVAYYAKPLDFQVTVIDNRSAYALPEFFPGAYAVYCSDFSDGIKNYKIDGNTYVVIATWSHQTDEECLKDVLNSPAEYVGMLGSTRKVSAMTKRLCEAGYTVQNLARLKAPIGININAQTPSEIAISILAEIISVRRTN